MDERPTSPYLELKPGAVNTDPQNYKFIISREKIHRIRCRYNYHAEIVHVVSPSEIWIRPLNHIANNLVISTENAPHLETDLRPNTYVMTPIDEETLVRARIIEYSLEAKRVLVRFIDHGGIAWRDENAIFEMKSERDEMRRYPWQTISLMLEGAIPKNRKHWTKEEVNTLERTRLQFTYYYVLPTIHDDLFINDDAIHISAAMHVLEKSQLKNSKGYIPADDLGDSLLALYRLNLPYASLNLKDENLIFVQKYYPYPEEDRMAYPYQKFEIKPNPAIEENKSEEVKIISTAQFLNRSIADDFEDEPIDDDDEDEEDESAIEDTDNNNANEKSGGDDGSEPDFSDIIDQEVDNE